MSSRLKSNRPAREHKRLLAEDPSGSVPFHGPSGPGNGHCFYGITTTETTNEQERKMAEQSRFGLTGLAVMGQNLARNVAHHGFPIAVHNRTTAKTEQFYKDFGHEGPIT